MTTTSGRLCVRCIQDRQAVVELVVKIGDEPGDVLDLCSEHKEAFHRDVYSWIRLSRPLPDQPERESWAPPRSGPPVRLRPPREKTSPPAHTARAPAAPAADTDWSLSLTAEVEGRAEGVALAEVYAAARAPDRTMPSHHGGQRVHLRGDVAVVVDPPSRRVISVLPRVTFI